MLFVRQSSSNVLMIGPFVDATDGVTPETGLTISNTDIQIAKQASASFTSKNSGGGTHVAGGYYTITLDSTDTNTAGRLQLYVNESGAAPVYHELMVLPANIADSFYLGTDLLQVDVDQIDGDATAAANLELAALGIVTGTAATGTLSTTQMTTNLTEATNDHYNGRMIVWTSGPLAGQASEITDYDGATKRLDYNTVTDAPANGNTFVIV
jgi:hypothetical protein